MSHQYATLEDSVYFGFVSNDTSGSAVDGTSPLFDVRLGGAAASAAPVLSGTPDLLTHGNYGPGAYEVAVAATAGNGFAAGNTYLVFVTLTADAQTPGSCLGSFTLGPVPADAVEISGDATAADNLELMYDGTGYTDDTAPSSRAQVGNLSVGSGGISTTSNSDTTVTTGTETLTYTATAQLDGSYHEVAQAASAIEMYYEFDIGGSGVPISVEWTGYVQTNNDNLEVYFRNWAGASWDQVGTIAGAAGTTPVTEQFVATIAHVGTGADLGKVRFRMASSGADVATNLATDRILVTYTVSNQSIGYEGGAVWIDTGASNTNTESFVDGTADNPVSTIAAATTIANNLNLKVFHVLPGSSLTLAQSYADFEWKGENYTLAFGAQSIDNAHIMGATVSGTFTGTPILERCIINAITGPGCAMRTCYFNEVTITNNGTSNWYLNDCRSRVAGTGSPNFDFGAAAGNTSLNLRAYSGGIELENMGGAGTDTASIEGDGQITLNANCSGGSLSYRGNFKFTDNASGAVDVLATSPVLDVVDQGTAQAGTANTITLAATASATDGQYDPGQVIVIAGAGAGQARSIIDYNGTTKVAVIDKDWRANPGATSSYVVRATSGQLHVNEGMAQAGAATTITLNSAASATDDIYIGQTVFVVGGTGQDQSRGITDYNGTTKVATVDKAWQTNPDATSSYVMLPLPGNSEVIADLSTRVPAALVGGRMDSNVGAISGSATAADNLEESTEAIIPGAASGTPTTTVMESDLTGYADDELIGRTIIWKSGTADGQASDITDYAATNGTITYTAITTAPVSGDNFVIV